MDPSLLGYELTFPHCEFPRKDLVHAIYKKCIFQNVESKNKFKMICLSTLTKRKVIQTVKQKLVLYIKKNIYNYKK